MMIVIVATDMMIAETDRMIAERDMMIIVVQLGVVLEALRIAIAVGVLPPIVTEVVLHLQLEGQTVVISEVTAVEEDVVVMIT
jgi:hypothetical protein